MSAVLSDGAGLWQVFGWVAIGLDICGNVLLGAKRQSGWLVWIVCNACWVPYAIASSSWAVLANHVVFGLFNVYGWYKWRRSSVASLGAK